MQTTSVELQHSEPVSVKVKVNTMVVSNCLNILLSALAYLHDAISLMFQNLNGGTLCLGQIKGTAYESIHADFREIHLSHGSWGNDTIKKIL